MRKAQRTEAEHEQERNTSSSQELLQQCYQKTAQHHLTYTFNTFNKFNMYLQ